MPSRGYLNFEYKPISLNEWLAPAMMATQYQRELEDKYLQLQSEVNAWDKIKANEQDSQLYENIYKPYIDAINNGVNELTSHGSNPNSRRRLYALTSQYNQVIKPIEDAYTKREQEQSKWREAQYKNPELIIEREPNTYSLEDFMNGTYTSPQIIDKGQVYKNAIASFQPLAKAIRKSPEWVQNHGYWEIRSQSGYTPDEIKQAILDPDNADPMLKAAIDNVISSSNAANWNNPDIAVDAITPIVNQALTYAIGAADTEYKADLEYQYELDRRKLAYKAGLDRSNVAYEYSLKTPKDSKDSGISIGRYPTANTEYSEDMQKYNKAWNVDGVKYVHGEWRRDDNTVPDENTRKLYNKYKDTYSYLDPEDAIKLGSSIDKTKSLSTNIGALFTSSDSSAKNYKENMIENLYADNRMNFYDRKKGKAVNANDWDKLRKKAKDDDYNNVSVTMDSHGLHIKIGTEWYDSMLPNGTTSAKSEIANADHYVNNIYNNLIDFSDQGVVVNSGDDVMKMLFNDTSTSFDTSPSLRHVRVRYANDPSGVIYNYILDKSNMMIYDSNSDDIKNGGRDFSNTMYEIYQSTLYDVMRSFSGPKTE